VEVFGDFSDLKTTYENSEWRKIVKPVICVVKGLEEAY